MSKSKEKLLKKKWKFEDIPNQSNKIVLVTGANSGLGLIATRELARCEATVIMACRSIEKAEKAKDEILVEVPNAKLDIIQLNLASLNSVKHFAEEFSKKYDYLDVLLNNAGIMQPPYMKTEDGFELQLGVNHLGHFALTALLFDKLRASQHARIVSISSIAHRQGKINFDDLNSEKKYSRSKAYFQSKLANLLFAYELNRRVKSNNINNVISVAAHPGYSTTNLQSAGPSTGGASFYSRLYKITDKIIAQSAEKGTLPILYAVVAPDVKGGDYFGPRGIYGIRGYPNRQKSNKRSYNEEDAKLLWQKSEELTGISFLF